MAFVQNPIDVSHKSCTGKVVNDTINLSMRPWTVAVVYSPTHRRLRTGNWAFEVSEVSGEHVGLLILKPGFEASTDPLDVELTRLLSVGGQLQFMVTFGDGTSESLSVNLVA